MTQPLVCHILIGLPASGKSTFAKLLAQQTGGLIVSTDAIRAQIYGDASNQGDWTEIEAEVFSQIRIAVSLEQSVIYDATNASHAWRVNFLQQFTDLPHICWIGWYLKIPIELCEQRNQKRDRQVPDRVIDSMAADLNQFFPTTAEGITRLHLVPLLANGEFDVKAIEAFLLQTSDC
jgi:predicted kinase